MLGQKGENPKTNRGERGEQFGRMNVGRSRGMARVWCGKGFNSTKRQGQKSGKVVKSSRGERNKLPWAQDKDGKTRGEKRTTL